jgi:virulence factor Mce-like protein
VQKQAPSAGRLLVIVGFALSCFGLLLFLWLAFGGAVPLKPKGYRIQASFTEGTQLAVEADVRISGVPVGRVTTVEPDARTGRSLATLELERRYAPLPRDSRAILRQKTLLGETYVELTPGDRAGPIVPEDGTLPATSVSPTVELDEIFRTFDAPTRRAFQGWMQDQALALRGHGQDLNDALGTLEPFAEETQSLVRVLNSQGEALARTVRDTGVVFDALSERRGQLRDLITTSNRVFTTTARRDERLRELFTVLPTFNTEARETVDRLTRFARTTDPLVSQLRPAARELGPTMRELGGLAPDLRALFRDLDPLVAASRRGLPATEELLEELSPALGELDPSLRQLNPILEQLRAYRSELTAFFANSAAATQAVGGDGVHYLRTLNPQNPENLAAYPRRVGANRTNAYRKPRGFDAIGTPGGPASYETRHCGAGDPRLAVTDPAALATELQRLLPALRETGQPATLGGLGPRQRAEQIATNLGEYFFGSAGAAASGARPAPACAFQGPFRVEEGALVGSGGRLSQYPQVEAARSGSSSPTP